MNRITLALITAAFALGLASAARAIDNDKPARIELREVGPARILLIAEDDAPTVKPLKTEKATFIGVVTAPITPELTAQLNLPPGVGLRIAQVMPDSPAAKAGLKEQDILHKLGDQLLVNSDQLRTLVRTHHKGDELTLTVITAGQSNQVKVTADEHDAPVIEAGAPLIRLLPAPGIAPAPGNVPGVAPGNDVNAQATATAVYRDDEHKLTLKNENGKKHLKVEDKDGKVLFNGPVNTPEERKAVPEAVQPKLDKLDASTRVHVGGGNRFLFQGADPANMEELRKRIEQQLKELQIELDDNPGGAGGVGGAQIDIEKLRERIRKQMDKALEGHQGAVQRQEIQIGPGGVQASATASYSDNEHSLTLKTTNGQKHLVAKDKAGKVLFDGPVNTDADKAKVPEEIRKKLDRLESSAKIHIQINPGVPGVPRLPQQPQRPDVPAPQVF